jgi:hypothetical protein
MVQDERFDPFADYTGRSTSEADDKKGGPDEGGVSRVLEVGGVMRVGGGEQTRGEDCFLPDRGCSLLIGPSPSVYQFVDDFGRGKCTEGRDGGRQGGREGGRAVVDLEWSPHFPELLLGTWRGRTDVDRAEGTMVNEIAHISFTRPPPSVLPCLPSSHPS